MVDKKTLLDKMQFDWQRLVSAVEGVPHDALERAKLENGRSIKAACCLLTAWDGETMRRIRFATDDRAEPPHDPREAQFWSTWEQKQIEVKSIMPMRGVMIDMIGTRRRLLEKIRALDDTQFGQWLAADPHAGSPQFAEVAAMVQAWRETWNGEHLSTGGTLLGGLKNLFGRRRK